MVGGTREWFAVVLIGDFLWDWPSQQGWAGLHAAPVKPDDRSLRAPRCLVDSREGRASLEITDAVESLIGRVRPVGRPRGGSGVAYNLSQN
jgi:hypothetical protein